MLIPGIELFPLLVFFFAFSRESKSKTCMISLDGDGNDGLREERKGDVSYSATCLWC